MHEVSCRALGMLLKAARPLPNAAAILTEGVPYDLDYLSDTKNHIRWDEWCRILRNARTLWTLPQMSDLGESFMRSPFFSYVGVVARFLFTTRDLFDWICKSSVGGGAQLFSDCVKPSYEHIGADSTIIRLEIAEQCEVSPEFFWMTRGSFIAMPRLVGAGDAQVDLRIEGRLGTYRIHYKNARLTLSSPIRLVLWPFTARAAARELKEAHEAQQERYYELDRANRILEVQAAQLRTANTITNLIHGDLALQPTMAAVTTVLVTEAGFAGSRLDIATDVEGQSIVGSSTHGDLSGPGTTLELMSSTRTLGKLAVHPRPSEEGAALLASLLPTIAMAVDNAVSHEFLTHYRQVLESQVAERTADLVASQQARDRIFANVNHEIRTPLTLMRIASGRLRSEAGTRLEPLQLQHLETIEYGTRKLLSLIDTILLLAARAEGKLELRASSCDLDTLLATMATAWRGAAEREGITLAYRGAALAPLPLDAEKIERAVANLLSNALKFTPQGGRIELGLHAGDDEVEVVVRDSGVGVSSDFRARAFGRFEQDKAPLRGSAGSGIGLSLVKEVAELHGGEARLESPAGGGTTVRVVLPRRETPAPAPGRNGAQQHERSDASPDTFGFNAAPAVVEMVHPPTAAPATVLVAEDEPLLRHELGRIIGEHYRVLLAPDGTRALELAREHLPDLLVSDVEMPGMNGLQLLTEYQKIPQLRMPSALLVTAHGHLDQRVTGLRSGAVDYVVKPFDPAELLARVQSQIALRAKALKAAKDHEAASLSVLTSGMAHELRNAANGLYQSIDLLKLMYPPELLAENASATELFEVAESSSKRIRQISMELLGVNPNGELVRRDVDWKALFSAARGVASSHFQGVELRNDFAYEGPLWCAEQLLVGVLSNLLINGAQAAGSGGWVHLSNRVEGDRLVFEVADSGKGVPPALRDKVFQLYFTTKAPGVGTGIGLYMCRQIMEKHGGVIDVRDGAGGALFHAELPLRKR